MLQRRIDTQATDSKRTVEALEAQVTVSVAYHARFRRKAVTHRPSMLCGWVANCRAKHASSRCCEQLLLRQPHRWLHHLRPLPRNATLVVWQSSQLQGRSRHAVRWCDCEASWTVSRWVVRSTRG